SFHRSSSPTRRSQRESGGSTQPASRSKSASPSRSIDKTHERSRSNRSAALSRSPRSLRQRASPRPRHVRPHQASPRQGGHVRLASFRRQDARDDLRSSLDPHARLV